MASEQNNNSSQKRSENYIWLAPSIAGGILIFMFIAILGIVLWKYLMNSKTSEENWAGPSPLADVESSNSRFNTTEFNLGIKCMPIACINTDSAMGDKTQIFQEQSNLRNGLNKESMENESTTTKPMATGTKCITVSFTTVDERQAISYSGPANQSSTPPSDMYPVFPPQDNTDVSHLSPPIML
ncbi:hypothetical protein XELAEV_18015428mg [Xenopus laevis]|uniref:Uncharacterized protein n=1 Tax=Xenopus laevis TaxID=8355 RepID=A0A974DI01_XENLA|nr:hypothetical protein XELAEV_18015428mg [Xenopus laevis]